MFRKVLTRAGFFIPWAILGIGAVRRLQQHDSPQQTLSPEVLSSTPEPLAPAPAVTRQDGIEDIAVEVWRLGRRIDNDANPNDRIRDSFDRLIRALDRANVTIEDPIGHVFIEGTRADILDAPDNIDLETEQLVVTDVLRPAVFVDGICIVPPQIILGRAPQNEEDANS